MDQPNLAAQAQMLSATKQAAAASIAGGIIAASGRPHSTEEAMSVFTDVYNSMFPAHGNGRFQAWQASHDPKAPHV